MPDFDNKPAVNGSDRLSSTGPITARAVVQPWIGASVPVSAFNRMIWGLAGLACGAVLVTAAMIHPDPRGFGTHEALGMRSCGFILMSGLPCPTCGMTTAYSQMMHGRPLAAFVAQPAGFVLCLGTMVGAVLCLRIAILGRIPWINWDRIGPVRVMLGFAALLIGGWAFKLVHGLALGNLPAR